MNQQNSWEEDIKNRFKIMVDYGIKDGCFTEDLRTPIMFVCRDILRVVNQTLKSQKQTTKEEIEKGIELYFDGLIVVSNPQLTKKSLKEYLLTYLEKI
jgi:hypothetical protein